jgi:hypothetical protein
LSFADIAATDFEVDDGMAHGIFPWCGDSRVAREFYPKAGALREPKSGDNKRKRDKVN